MIHGNLSVGYFSHNFEFDLKRQFLVGVFWTPDKFLWFHSMTIFNEFFVNLFQEYALSHSVENYKFKDCDWFISPKELSNYGMFESNKARMNEIFKLGCDEAVKTFPENF